MLFHDISKIEATEITIEEEKKSERSRSAKNSSKLCDISEYEEIKM